MKRITALILSLLMVASMLLAGCGEQSKESTASSEENTTAPTEAEPTLPAYDYTLSGDEATIENPYTEWPDYTLKEGASVSEMRQMAVKVMRDMLTIPWTPNVAFKYDKSVGLTKTYEFPTKIPYGGLPYTTAGTGIFQWLEYYDMTNGVVFNLPGNIDEALGNSCAASASWGIAAVSPTMYGVSTYQFVPENGAYLVGGLTIADNVTSLRDYHTSIIIEDNGAANVIAAYQQIQPGDVLIACLDESTDHAVMAIDVPHVEFKADGSVDMEKSYVRIQDQRAKDYFEEVDGYQRSIRGRLDYQMTFQEMLSSAFVAFAPKEFLEEGTYVLSDVKLNKEVSTLDELLKASVLSNYRIASVHARVYNEAGGLVFDQADVLRGSAGRDAQKYGYKVSSAVSKNILKRNLNHGQTYTISIEVRIATGELIKLGNITFTNE